MSGTHQQLIYHIIFSTKNRYPLLTPSLREHVFPYMTGICKKLEGLVVQIGGVNDHCHLLVHIPPKVSVSDFVGKLKGNTSRHINTTCKSMHKFGWQEGFGAFSVSVSQVNRVKKYVQNQEEHHKSIDYKTEFVALLKKHNIDYDPDTVWK